MRQPVVWLGIVSLIVLSIAKRPSEWMRGPSESYVLGASDLASGRFGPGLYDDRETSDRIASMTQGRVRDVFSPAPPSTALAFLPLAYVPGSWLPIGWAALNVAALIASLVLIARTVTWPDRHPLIAVFAVGCLLLSAPFGQNLHNGQAYLLMMTACAWVVAGDAARKSVPAAIGLAWLALSKLAGWPTWVLFAAMRDWRTLAVAFALIVAAVAASLPLIGLSMWLHYFTVVLPTGVSSPKATVTAYQTVPSFLAHAFRWDAEWNPSPVADIPFLAAVLTAAIALVLVGATVALARRNSNARLRAVAASIVLSVLLSPVAEQYHYLMVVPSIAVAIEHVRAGNWRHQVILALALLLLALPIPYRYAPLATWGFGLAAYPRVAGGILLWLTLLWPRERPEADK